ncbi:MAG: M20/M25/M40 family metallo-hydrolase [Bacteroidota bacterium]
MRKLNVFIVFLFCPIISFAQTEVKGDCSDNIRVKNLMKTVTTLASAEMQGRLSGGPGYKKAAKMMAIEFSELGLKSYGKDFFQEFKTEYNEITNPGKLVLNKADGVVKAYQLGVDYVYRVFTGSGKVSSNVVFCGYGISEPDQGYDDYQDMEVKGKIVMVYKQNPSWKLGEKSFTDAPRDKAYTAKKHGAAALILVSKPEDEHPQKPIGSAMEGKASHVEDVPVLHVEIPVAEELLNMTPGQLLRLQQNIDKLKKPLHAVSETICDIEVQAKYIPDASTYNVAALLEGSDPILKKEYVIVSAHLDHVGKQGTFFFPGANDNASGSAGVLEIARALSACNYQPKRSILFVLFSSEEHGLDGSKYFAANLPDSAQKIVAILNMDCIAFGDSIHIGNGESSPLLWKDAKTLDAINTNYTVSRTWKGGGADLSPFHEKGIPGLYFASTNSYGNLHLPSDLPETLNKPLYEMIVKLVCKLTVNIADGQYKREVIIK